MKKNKTKKKNHIFAITLSILLIIIIVLIVVLFNRLAFWKNTNTKLFANDTNINGIDLSGLTPAEAYEAVGSYISDKSEDFILTLKYNDQIHILDKDDYSINSDLHTLIDLIDKGKDVNANSSAKSINVSFNYIFKGLDEKIENICQNIETKPINSEIIFNPNNNEMFEITKSSVGYMVNREKLYKEINKQFAKSNNILVDLVLEETQPEITEEYNNSLTSKISSYSTNVSDSTGGRKANVKLALEKFNGKVIMPGQTVSFNKITRPHTLENGYKIATIIYNGRFVDGIGGGICQASTTLYNALLLAGANINEVHKHTLPVKYTPLALDAMVNEDSADMIFTNTSDYPLFIKTSATANDVTVEIYSKTLDNGISYSTRSETIKTLPALKDKIVEDINNEYCDKVIFKGETYRLTYPRDGFEAKAYLQTWKDGNMIEEKLIRHEIYQPQPGIIIEGTKEPLNNMQLITEQTSETLNPANQTMYETIN